MSIQRCPNEVLDMVFQLLPYQSTDKAPAVLLSTMLTCTRFCAIAKRHLTRVICLQTAKRVNLFAAYLTQLMNTGQAQIPVEHMAVFGKYQTPRRGLWQNPSEAEKAAEHNLPFILSTVAPSLHSLVIFGFDSPPELGYAKNVAESSVCFQNLQNLILLEQRIISLGRKPEDDSLYPALYPRLTSLYTHNGGIDDNVLALHTLRNLRLDMLGGGLAPPGPSAFVPHIEAIIIDAPPYKKKFGSGCCVFQQTRERYRAKIESYHAFVTSNATAPKGCVVVAKPSTDLRVRIGRVLRAWKDIVQGGSGCWERGWKPTA
jgi:hypothetical protein